MFGSFVAVLMTSTLSFAIVCVNQSSGRDTNSTDCTQAERPLFWTKSIQGLLLGGSFYGLVASQFLIGYLSDKYGRCKLQMLVGAAFLGLANIFSPMVILHLGDYYFFALRILMGLATVLQSVSILPFSLSLSLSVSETSSSLSCIRQTCVISSAMNLVRHWASPRDQGLLVGLCNGGGTLAYSVINPISAAMCNYGGWQSIFYLAGKADLLPQSFPLCLQLMASDYRNLRCILVVGGGFYHPRHAQAASAHQRPRAAVSRLVRADIQKEAGMSLMIQSASF